MIISVVYKPGIIYANPSIFLLYKCRLWKKSQSMLMIIYLDESSFSGDFIILMGRFAHN